MIETLWWFVPDVGNVFGLILVHVFKGKLCISVLVLLFESSNWTLDKYPQSISIYAKRYPGSMTFETYNG